MSENVEEWLEGNLETHTRNTACSPETFNPIENETENVHWDKFVCLFYMHGSYM